MKRNEELTEQDQLELLLEFNKDDSTLVKLAMYFGNAKTAASAKITEIDVYGFLLKYIERGNDGLDQKEVRIQYDLPATSIKDLHHKFLLLKKEALSCLAMNVDKSYVPPGRKSTKDEKLFVPLGVFEYSILCLLWALVIGLAYTPSLPLYLIKFQVAYGFDLREFAKTILLSALCINMGLALSVFGMGIYSEFPFVELFLSFIVTLFGGFLGAGPMIKIAYRRKARMDSEDVIGSAR